MRCAFIITISPRIVTNQDIPHKYTVYSTTKRQYKDKIDQTVAIQV